MDDATAHQWLDMLLNNRRACEREGSAPHLPGELLAATLDFARDFVMTKPVFDRAMLHGEDGEGLLLFANRMKLLEPLLSRNWPADFSYVDVVHDAFAIAHGDEPRVFARSGKQGRFGNAHRLLELKLEARAWYKVLRRLKVRAPEVESIVLRSHGATKDAFNDWLKEAKRKLGALYVDEFLHAAENAWYGIAILQKDAAEWAKAEAKAAGRRYLVELGRAKV